jgi:hypothetical protein
MLGDSLASLCDRHAVVTESWVDDDHLRAIGRVVVAATWTETMLDHVVRVLVDDGPIYDEMVVGQQVSRLSQLAVKLATRVVMDSQAVTDLTTWTQRLTEAQENRNRIVHAAHIGSEDGSDGRTLMVETRGKRRSPPVEVTESAQSILALADDFDRLSAELSELTGRLVAGYIGRSSTAR